VYVRRQNNLLLKDIKTIFFHGKKNCYF